MNVVKYYVRKLHSDAIGTACALSVTATMLAIRLFLHQDKYSVSEEAISRFYMYTRGVL